jgi:hypothetical protein
MIKEISMYKKLCLLLLVGAFAAHVYGGFLGNVVGQAVGGAARTGEAAVGTATGTVSAALEPGYQTAGYAEPVYGPAQYSREAAYAQPAYDTGDVAYDSDVAMEETAAPQGEVDIDIDEVDVQRNAGRPSLGDAADDDSADDFETSGNDEY